MAHDQTERDATDLYNAMKGLGTDENVLIAIMSHRSKQELHQIIEAYERLFGHSLKDDLEGDLSCNFRRVLVGLSQPLNVYRARFVRKAIEGAGTDEHALIDVLTQCTNEDIRAIRYHYELMYGDKENADQPKEHGHGKLERDIVGDTSFNFKRVLLELCKGEREEVGPPYGNEVSRHEAQEDAVAIYKAGEGRLGTDDHVFVHMMSKRSPWHLQVVDQIYREQRGHGLIDAIKSETSGFYKDTLLALVKLPEVYWAERAHHAIAGLGTDDKHLIYVMVSNTKHQLRIIADTYASLFQENFEDAIRGDTSGDYKKVLIELIRD